MSTILKNIQQITKEVKKTKKAYETNSKKFVKSNEIEKALEARDMSGDLSTLEVMLTTISERFNPILKQLEIGDSTKKKNIVEKAFVEETQLPQTEKKKRGRPRKNKETVESTIAELVAKKEVEEPKTKEDTKLYQTPIKMTLLGKDFEINKNWREVYINTLEEMIAKHPKIVKGFAKSPDMQGRTMIYFTMDSEVPMISKHQLSNGMYVNLNLSSTAILNNCYKVLEKCGVSKEELSVEVVSYKKNEKIARKNLNL